MDVAHEMNEKREVAGGAPFVIVAIAKATGILVDFRRDAVSLWAPRRQILLRVLAADVDVMPSRRLSIFLAKLGVRPNRRRSHGLFD